MRFEKGLRRVCLLPLRWNKHTVYIQRPSFVVRKTKLHVQLLSEVERFSNLLTRKSVFNGANNGGWDKEASVLRLSSLPGAT